ncbi:DNA-binding protein [Clostridium sp. DL1XJH146]
MNRSNFDNLDTLGQIKYINQLLLNGDSLRIISTQLHISKTTIRDRFKKIGYSFDSATRQYTKQYDKNNIKVLQTHKTEENKSQKNNTLINKDNSSKEMHDFINMKDDLIELINVKENILDMLKNYENNTIALNSTQIDINIIPGVFKSNIVTKSIKVYKPIFDEFTALCEKNKGIKKQDMISLALFEFISKYK